MMLLDKQKANKPACATKDTILLLKISKLFARETVR